MMKKKKKEEDDEQEVGEVEKVRGRVGRLMHWRLEAFVFTWPPVEFDVPHPMVII